MRKTEKKRSFKEWFKELSKPRKVALISSCLLVLLFLILSVYVASKFSKINTESIGDEDIYITDIWDEDDGDLGTGYTNFVLFGGDSRTGEVTSGINTDAIIIISLNNETKEIKLTVETPKE